jgi:hypothetical protein
VGTALVNSSIDAAFSTSWTDEIEEHTMRKFTSLALIAALGLGAAALSKPADAAVAVGVGVGLPGVAVVAPPVVAPAPLGVYYRYPRFSPGWYGGWRHGYGYGWHRGWYHGRYWR